MSKKMAKENPKMQVKTLDNKRMKIIKWADVDMSKDAYVLKVYPTNLLADDPSSRLQDVTELMASGLINQRTASSLLEFPDIENAMSLQNSIVEDIRATIEDIVDEGLYSPPEPFQDLEYAIPQMQSAYIKYKRSNVEIERLELFTRWIEDAMLLVSPPAAQAEEELDPEMEAEMLEEETVGPDQAIDEMVAQEEMPQEMI